MDDDDSQDELINRNTSHSKGRRVALWAISDDSDDAEEESEVGESDSSEEQEEGHQDGEDEEEEEEEGNDEEDDEEEGEDKAEDGAFGETSADLAGISSDEDTEKCPICLNSFSSQPVATPENCLHYFCLDCILEWTKNANSCPVDRIAFDSIYLRKCYGGKVKKMITIQKPVKEGQEERIDLDLELTSCEVCGGSDREDRLLLCDGCDAGYHMECLTPPIDSVPVEEWFCPECDANNHHSRASDEELNDTENLPSTARPATSHSQAHVPGPTRAIARTQQSERVRANVNRHRITQARTSQLAPTYLIQSTWLDETINAVVAGLNTSVYVRDFTPRVPSRRRRKTRKRGKVKMKTSSRTGKKGRAASTGVKGRKRKGRRTKSRKKLVLKRATTSRNRIANNLGIVKGTKTSSLPTVYRPSEHTLSGMRADIGAASLSIYGDPFDLDPFVDHEEEEQQARVTSLLEAKRRGISRSALRSHHPVARPITAGLSRRSLDVPQSEGVVEASPVPDLLGSILSGQSMLLMDSSDVIINRDGSLKATKPMMGSKLKTSLSTNGSSGDSRTQINPETLPNQGEGCLSPPYNRDQPGSFHSSMNRTFSQCSPRFPSHVPSSANYTQPFPNSNLPPRGHLGLQPPHPIRSTQSPGHRVTNGVGAACPNSSIHPTIDCSSKSKEMSTSKKAPIKPTWVDVSVLPRIPKIKRESNDIPDDGSNGSSNSSRSSSTTSSNGYGMPETCINSLAGDMERKQSVDRQKSRSEGQAQRPRPSATGPSSAFSNSFSSSSNDSPASHPHYSSSSSNSSAVSFRINSSGNSWHSRRLNVTSSSTSGGSMQKPWREKEEATKKRLLHRDKQMLLASRTMVKKEKDSNNIYDPFNPTMSDSSNSDDESECKSPDSSSQHTTQDEKAPICENKRGLVQNNQDLAPVKAETHETDISEEPPKTTNAQGTISEGVRCSEEHVNAKKESRDTESVKQTALLVSKIKKEHSLEDPEETKRIGDNIKSFISENPDTEPPVNHCLELIKTESETLEEENVGTLISAHPNCKNDSSASSFAPIKNKQKTETKSDFNSYSKSKDSVHKKKASEASKERRSSSPETDRARKGDRQREKKEDQGSSTGRSRSRERRRVRSTSDSSQSSSPDKTPRKRWRSRSRSKSRRQSRSDSSSSSRECSRTTKHKQRSKERRDGRERDSERRQMPKSKRHGRSRSKSRSRSRSRSRSKDYKRGRSVSKSRSRSRERRKGHTRLQQSPLPSGHRREPSSKDKKRHRSRSSSRERTKDGSSSKGSQKTTGSCVPSSKDLKQLQTKKKEKDIIRRPLKEEEVVRVDKQETSSATIASKVKNEGKDVKTESQATTAEMAKETLVREEIKKEKQPSLDIFEDYPIIKAIKQEQTDTPVLIIRRPLKEEEVARVDKQETSSATIASKVKNEGKDVKTESQATTAEMAKETLVREEIKKEKQPSLDIFEDYPIIKAIKQEQIDTPVLTVEKEIDEAGNKEAPIKTETCEIPIIKSESSFSESCNMASVTSSSTLTTLVTADCLQDTVSQAHPVLPFAEEPNTAELTVAVKQEVQQPSDSDDDFNVDVMLDNLDSVKSEQTESLSVKQEERKTEGGQILTVLGAKSKTQVKRVTWNIQEPEGPQPEKSASKLTLYRLRLKQEGSRRPSSTGQSTSQAIPGVVSDPSKECAAPLSSSSQSDGSHPEASSTRGQGEAEEGDLLTKDKYLKKLHMQERAVEEVKLAIKPFYQRRDITKDEYKEILRKAVQKVCHSKSGEINPVKVGNLVKAYVDKYKHARKHKKVEDSGKAQDVQNEATRTSESP